MNKNLQDVGVWLTMMGAWSAGLWRYMNTVVGPWSEKTIREALQPLLDSQNSMNECLHAQLEQLIRLENSLSEQNDNMNRMQARVEDSVCRLGEAVNRFTTELREMRKDDKRARTARTPSPKEFTPRRGATRSPISVLGGKSALGGQKSVSSSKKSVSSSESSVKGSRRAMDQRKTAPVFKSASIVAVDGPGRSAHFSYAYGRPDCVMRSAGREIASPIPADIIDEDSS